MKQQALIFAISMLLYVVLPVLMMMRDWIISAGLAMLVLAQLPVIWQVNFTRSEMPGFALLAIVLSAIALVLILVRLAVLIVQRISSPRSRKSLH